MFVKMHMELKIYNIIQIWINYQMDNNKTREKNIFIKKATQIFMIISMF